ncbi:MAG: ATP-grasp domain-containing protein, partial [Limnohabitans sp.]
MFGLAARRNGYGFVVFGDHGDSPAGQIADHTFSAEFLDEDALKQFAAIVDVVSYEQENIPVRTVEVLQQCVPVYPGPALLKASQNRLLEKTALRSIGIPTADFLRITTVDELTEGVRSFGGDGILKTVTLGYDGKGQARVRSQQDMATLWSRFKTSEAILEK